MLILSIVTFAGIDCLYYLCNRVNGHNKRWVFEDSRCLSLGRREVLFDKKEYGTIR